MVETRGLRLAPSASVKEKRLAVLLAGRDPRDPALEVALVEAQARGSVDLAGLIGPEAEAAAEGVRRALTAVDARMPLSVDALLAWGAAVTGVRGLRTTPRDRADGPPP